MKKLLLSLGLLAWPSFCTADPRSEVLSYSIFPNVEMARLEQGGVQQVPGSTMTLAAGLTAQALFIVDVTPAQMAHTLAYRDPSSHTKLKVWLHQQLPTGPVTPASFSALNRLPNNSSVKLLADATAALKDGSDSELNLSKAEIEQQSGTIAALSGSEGSARIATLAQFWSNILSGRFNAFLRGQVGSGACDYEVDGEQINPLSEIHTLLKSDPKVNSHFSDLLSRTPFGTSGTGDLGNVGYYESFDEEGTTAIGTGTIYIASSSASTKVADVEFYANYGTYVVVQLYEIWPITTSAGKPASLVWRDDLVTSPQVGQLKGTEKMGARDIMLQRVKEDISALRDDLH